MTTATAAPPGPAACRPYHWSRAEYYRLGELGFFDGKRVERIRGEIVEMSPINWPHTLACTKTGELLRELFLGTGWVSFGNPLPTEDSDPQPDVAVYPSRPEDYSDHPTNALLVVEVSHTTLDRDTTVKAELYAEASVADYWVIDLEARRLLVFRDPQPLPAGLGATAYRTCLTLGEADSVAPLAEPAASVRVGDMLP